MRCGSPVRGEVLAKSLRSKLARYIYSMAENTARNAVVTGASSGIGAATVRALRAHGWNVVAVARRADRLLALAAETGAIACPADISKDDDVARLRRNVTDAFAQFGGVDTVINIAGGARGVDPVGSASVQDWEWMYQVNVLGTLKVIQAFLPELRAHGRGTVLNLTSTAGLVAYEGGAGYNAAKFGQHALNNALRLEEAEHNVRVMPEDVADVVRYAVELPQHINLDQIVVRPVAQAAAHKLIRNP